MKLSLVCKSLVALASPLAVSAASAQGALMPATGPATPTVAPSVATAQRGQPVMLAFRDVEIAEVVSAFSASMGLPFLVDARVKGRITLEAPKPVSLDKAYELLVSTLSLQGFSAIRANGFVRVVPTTEAKLFVPGMSESAGGMSAATRIFVLQHEDANQMMASIRALVPASNPITVNPSTNSLIISDTAENLARIGEVVAALDKPELGLLRVVTLQHAHVSDLMPTVDQLVNAPRGQAAKGAVTQQSVSLLADLANNRLLLRSFSGAKLDQTERLVRELDTPLSKPGNVNVVYLKNAEAVRLALSLQAIYTGAAASPVASAPSPATPSLTQSGSTQSGSMQPRPASASATAPAGAAAVSLKPGVMIQAEPTLNALLVVAPPSVYKEIRSVIDQLDVRRAQVYIESLIVEVNADRAAEFGVQFQYLNGLNENTVEAIGGTNFNARGGGTNLLDLAANPLAASQGLNVGVIKGTVSFGGNTIANLGLLARALESQGGGNIIATPNLLTLDNEEAKIVIGQNVPFITGSFTTSGSNAGNPFQTIERKDVGTTLRVRPLVTEGGVIKLQIFQEVSSVSQRLTEGIITNKRSIESTVLVDDQQMVVLGGLIQDENSQGEGKVPGLGDIPLLGQLFRYDTAGRRKTNLFVFLRPVVIRSSEDSNRLTMGRYEAMQAQRAAQPARTNAPLLPELGRPELPAAPRR